MRSSSLVLSTRERERDNGYHVLLSRRLVFRVAFSVPFLSRRDSDCSVSFFFSFFQGYPREVNSCVETSSADTLPSRQLQLNCPLLSLLLFTGTKVSERSTARCYLCYSAIREFNVTSSRRSRLIIISLRKIMHCDIIVHFTRRNIHT